MAKERIQKVLAQAGYGSRREIEAQIRQGRIRLNAKVATLGDKADAHDAISLDGRRLNFKSRLDTPCRVLLYKKHVGQVVTRRDPEGRPTVFKKLPKLKGGRWLAVGRLDINTSGLLIMTTDGELKRRLEHPSFAQKRQYAVRIHGQVTEAMLEKLVNGVMLEDGQARFEYIKPHPDRGGLNQWYDVVALEGRNRVVRRLWASQGVEVSRLIRTGFGPLSLPGGIKAGTGKELSRKEVRKLAAAVGLQR